MPPKTYTAMPQYAKQQYHGKNTNGNLSFPSKPLPHTMLMVFKEYDFKRLGNFGLLSAGLSGVASPRSRGVGLRSIHSIELPFPTQLQDNTNLRINGFERDKSTEFIANKIRDFIGSGALDGMTIADIPKILTQLGAGAGAATGDAGAGDLLSQFGSSIAGTGLSEAGKSAQYLLRSKLPGDIGRSIDTVTGNTVNPRETLAFEGVDLRTHDLSWELFPSNQTDSSLIRRIIRRIKQKALPVGADFAGLQKAFLQYPATVDIFLLGVNQEHFMKYKTSMITGFNVDYGAGGLVAIAKGGKPAAVQLSLQLTELEIQTANDYGVTAAEITNPMGDGAGDDLREQIRRQEAGP